MKSNDPSANQIIENLKIRNEKAKRLQDAFAEVLAEEVKPKRNLWK